MMNVFNINKSKKIFTAGIIIFFYSVLSILYFTILDQKFYAKNVLNNDITFAFPIFYMFLACFFMCVYSLLLKQKLKTIVHPIIAMALILPLFYLLTDLKIGMLENNPFGGNRNIYGIYSSLYYLLSISIFSILIGLLLRKLVNDEIPHFLAIEDSKIQNFIFHLPIYIYFVFIEAILFINGFVLHAVFFLILFLSALLFEMMTSFLKRFKIVLLEFLTNERLFLITIFILSFLIRYLWGMRILGITGENFIIASDDGLTYDPFAATIAQGGIIPKGEAFYLSGFGYWYFLAGIYKIFGLHNFKAMIVIQGLIGALIPVFTYLIGKKIFKSRLVPILASIMTSLNPTLIFLSIVIGMEAVYIPLLIGAITISTYLLLNKQFTYGKAFIIGAVFGLANNARSEVLLFPVILAVLLYLFLKNKMKIKKIIFFIAALFLGFIFCMSIQHITSYFYYGEYRLTSAALGATFTGNYGTNENALLDALGFNPFKSIPISFYTFLHNHTTVMTLIIKGFFKRIIIYYFKPNFGVFDPIYLVNPASGYFFRFPVWVQSYEYIFILVGIFFAFFKNKENLIAKTMLLVFALYISSMYGFIWVTNARHRGVLMPIFILFFAYGVYIFCRKVKNSYIRP